MICQFSTKITELSKKLKTVGNIVLSLTFHIWDKSGLIKRVHGKDRLEFLEKVIVGDVASQTVGNCNLSLILNDRAGIIDDTIFSNHGEHLFVKKWSSP